MYRQQIDVSLKLLTNEEKSSVPGCPADPDNPDNYKQPRIWSSGEPCNLD